jgi:hypothetical protein
MPAAIAARDIGSLAYPPTDTTTLGDHFERNRRATRRLRSNRHGNAILRNIPRAENDRWRPEIGKNKDSTGLSAINKVSIPRIVPTYFTSAAL